MPFNKTKSHKKLNKIDIKVDNIEKTLIFTLWTGLIIGILGLLYCIIKDFLTTMPIEYGFHQIMGIIGSIAVIVYCVVMLKKLKEK